MIIRRHLPVANPSAEKPSMDNSTIIMVRTKQNFPKDSPCCSSSLQDLDAEPVQSSGKQKRIEPVQSSGKQKRIEPVQSSGKQKRIEPVQSSGKQKRIEPVQSSGKQKRSETNLTNEKNGNKESINLDEMNDFSYTSDEEHTMKSYVAQRKAKQRKLMDNDEKEKELFENRFRIGLKRAKMTEEEISYVRKNDRVRHALKRMQMTDQELENQKTTNLALQENTRKRKREFCSLHYLAATEHQNTEFYQLGKFNIKCLECDSLHFPEEKAINSKENVFFNCCKGGKLITLSDRFDEYPEELKALFFANNPFYKNFIKNIRRYNSIFACASISCFKFKFPTPGPPCYKIQGQIYHKFNPSAMPKNEKDLPTNGQLYFIDSEEAINIRCEIDKECLPDLLEYIEKYLRKNNPFAQSYLMMKEVYEQEEKKCKERGYKMPNIKLLFSLKENYDQRRYNIPMSNEVCAIMVSDANDDVPPARIVVYPKGQKELKEIYPLDKCVDPMCYPLLYPTNIEGYNVNIKDTTGKKVSLCDYTKFFLFFRENEKFFPHFYASKLFQQWLVDQAAKIEWDRLEYIRTHQAELWSSNYLNVEDFLKNRASKTGAEIRKKVILPSTFSGGPRSMHEHFMNAMAIVNESGKPDLFITFTCNPNDPDILKCLLPGQTPSDRPDIVTRVFYLKKTHLLDLILNKHIFGEVIANCWVIEYQKRGLPHLHLLVTLHPKNKWHSTADIDKFICAEIPSEKEDPVLFKIITNCMMHGPCNEKSMCWNKLKKKCGKKFPKTFRENTELNEDGYPLYKRPDNGRFIYRKGQKLTNQYVVPYNPFLSKTFNAHINIERVSDISVVKYLYDYIYKGYDSATVECIQIEEDGTKKILKYDEVGAYLEARYLSPCEACWRILKYPMQGKSHSVDLLDVHLENMQRIFYKKNAPEEQIEEASVKDTTLTAYFKFCQQNPTLKFKYIDMPKYCTWLKRERKWKYPRQNNQKKIGRIVPVNPIETEKYYLRFLLLNVYGKNYKELRTVNGKEYETYAQACLAHGLTRDDQEWHKCMEEASYFSRKNSRELRMLFVNILVHCAPKYPEQLWNNYKDHLVNDIKRRFPDLRMEEIYEKGLVLINQCLAYHDKSLSDFKNMPKICGNKNKIDEDEIYDPKEELNLAEKLIKTMNDDQKHIIDLVISLIKGNNEPKCIFIDGPGGTGKSFTLKAIYHLARAHNKKICNMAFSGIAATILKKGRTLHNRFKLPLNIKKNSTSGIESAGKEAEEIKETDIFIWDEAPMASRFVLDIIDCKLKELMRNESPFGGKVFILSGDFRQCLPIKEFAPRTEIVDLLIKNSPLWVHFNTLKLTINMRAEEKEREFARKLIEIGNGTAGEKGFITVPDECICKGDLVDEIYGDLILNELFEKMSERAILSPFNSIVDEYNENIIKRLPGEYHTYLSIDESDPNSDFPISHEILNSLKCPSLPNHKIELKTNSMIMLLRNLNVREGLCNGTRMQIKEMGDHVISCVIKSGDKTGETTLIPRITLLEDKKFPFPLRRHQFPIKPAFAFTINKSQSQTFSKIGIDYTDEPFAHGQTYVAFSRCKSWKGLKIKLLDDNKERKIKNIVWQEILK